MTDLSEILRRARVAAAKAGRERASPRFLTVMGKLTAVGLLVSNTAIPKHRGRIRLKDYLWAAAREPRLYELLPALIVKCPAYFSDLASCPSDLKDVVRCLKNGSPKAAYHGVPSAQYLQWIPRVGRKDKEPTTLKSFRLTQADLRTLRELHAMGYTDIAAVRLGLRLALEDAKVRSR